MVALLLTLAVVALALTLALLRLRGLARARVPLLFSIPEFTLTNQLGHVVSLAGLRGRVWVADIIFTRCAGPCPKMTQRMSEIQAALPLDTRHPTLVTLVTLTTDADYDTPAVLNKYGERFGAQPGRWWLLTGDKRAIANLAIDGFKFVAMEKKPEERTDPADLFVHSTHFVLVDKQGRARAVFDYEEPDMVSRLLASVRLLLEEK